MAQVNSQQTTCDSLTDEQRTLLKLQLDKEGYITLPFKLPKVHVEELLAAIDHHRDPTQMSQKQTNIVDLDPAFRKLMGYRPALQLCYDCFGPMFHLCQSNFFTRKQELNEDSNVWKSWSPWHADGPRPAQFPQFKDGSMGLHYLKFGYFLSDLTHRNGGSLEIVRGSHLRPELDRKGENFNINDYKHEVIKLDVEAGTVIAFHQAQWHAAGSNKSTKDRINCYLSYCPTWMRPIDREFPTEEALQKLGNLSPEERWLLGEPRPAIRWFLPTPEDQKRMSSYARTHNTLESSFLIPNYQ